MAASQINARSPFLTQKNLWRGHSVSQLTLASKKYAGHTLITTDQDLREVHIMMITRHVQHAYLARNSAFSTVDALKKNRQLIPGKP
jgi:hypothetical protein